MEIDRVNEWLDQFEFQDRYLAKYIISKMRYVCFEEVEIWLQQELLNLISEINLNNKEAIAIFPVAKPFINEFNKDKEIKLPNDSSGRIAHSIKNLERRLPKHIELTPRLESMRDRKVRHIIFIDDFIGTGDRFIKSWQKTVSRSIKSWCARGWCKIWILAFAGHESGISNIVNRIGPVDGTRVRVNLRIKKSFIADNKNLLFLIKKYGITRHGEKGTWGYGKLLSPLVFQYGCPNNVPSILWSKVTGKNKWMPLFPERSIPTELYPLFSSDLSSFSSAEDVWMAGNYELAIQMIDKLNDYNGNHHLMVVLALLERKKEISKIKNVMILSDKEFAVISSELTKYGLIDANNQITSFGKEILARGKKDKSPIAEKYEHKGNFYPASFLGFQREV